MNLRTEHQNLPGALVEVLDDLDAPALRTVRAHVEQCLNDLRSTLSDVIRSKTGSEVVDITDSGPYALVRKYCSSGNSSGAGRRTLSLPGGTREATERRRETPLVIPRGHCRTSRRRVRELRCSAGQLHDRMSTLWQRTLARGGA